MEDNAPAKEPKAKSKMVHANFYQLMSIEGKFTKENPKQIRKNVILERSYVERVNASSATSGKMYVIDEKATDEYHTDSKVIVANKKENDKIVKETGNLLKEVVSKGLNNKKKAEDLG